MFKLARNLGRHVWLAVFWSVLTQILLILPGSVFPGKGIFSLPHIDKVAHIGLFGGLTFFWAIYLYLRKNPPYITNGTLWTLVGLFISYGVLIEFVQKNYVPNRSFDPGDIMADAVGSLIGYIVTQWFLKWHAKEVYKKN